MKAEVSAIFYRDLPSIQASDAEVDTLRTAKENVLHLLYIEEKLDYVLENFAEFERAMLDLSVREYMFEEHGWSEGVASIHRLGRHIANLFSSGKLYIDHVKHHFSAMFGRTSKEFEAVKRWHEEESTTCLSFRVVEALRNFTQHRGLPLSGLKTFHELLETHQKVVSGGPMSHATAPYIEVRDLEEDTRFSRTILQELQALGTQLDLRPFVREYVSGIGRIHDRARVTISAVIGQYDRVLEDWRNRLGIPEEGERSIEVVRVDVRSNLVERFSFLAKFAARRQHLIRKNAHTSFYFRHAATGVGPMTAQDSRIK